MVRKRQGPTRKSQRSKYIDDDAEQSGEASSDEDSAGEETQVVESDAEETQAVGSDADETQAVESGAEDAEPEQAVDAKVDKALPAVDEWPGTERVDETESDSEAEPRPLKRHKSVSFSAETK